MVKLNKKEFERIKTTKIDDVNYGIDELDNEYIEVYCGDQVERILIMKKIDCGLLEY